MDLSRSGRTRLIAAAATVVTAAVGSVGTRPDSAWYRRLRKPPWQPPTLAFPVVWTALYGLIGWAGGQALTAEQDEEQRRRLAAVLAADLAVNAGWCWVFFTARRTGAGLATIVVLDALNVELVRRAWAADSRAGKALLPYTAWSAFATVLNGDIWRRNRGRALV